jgi:hypothetical protein
VTDLLSHVPRPRVTSYPAHERPPPLTMAGLYPHWPENQTALILNLPSGHWFFQKYDRLTRTPRPDETLHRSLPPGSSQPSDIPFTNSHFQSRHLLSLVVTNHLKPKFRPPGTSITLSCSDLSHLLSVTYSTRKTISLLTIVFTYRHTETRTTR